MAQLFDQAFQEYQSKLNNYQEAVNNYKQQLEQFKERPAEVIGRTLTEVGVPLAIELARKSLRGVSKGDPAYDANQASSGGDEVNTEPVEQESGSAPENNPDVQETSFPSELPTEDAEQVTETDSAEVGGSEATADELSDIMRSTFSIEEPEAMAGTSSNIIGRLFRGIDSPMQAARNLMTESQNAVQQVVSATGATAQVAEDALQTGATAIQGGKKLITGALDSIATTGEAVGETAEAGLGAAAAGAETFDPVALAGGLLVAGIGSLVSALSDHKPAPVAVPNVPEPTFQAGLATSN